MAVQLRLDKYLTDMSLGTRAFIKEEIKKGKVLLNGEVCRRSETKVSVKDQIRYNGKPVAYVNMEYYMLNKPQGVVSATKDKHHKTVMDLLEGEKRKDLFPVGRLDIDTEGLLLITNDGDLAHQLLSPKKHVNKIYYAKIEGRLPDDCIEQFKKGILLKEGIRTQPAHLMVFSEGLLSEVQVTIQEGKFHQVKRMFQALGVQVVYLKRLSMGPLILDDSLPLGSYRHLTEKELTLLKKEENI